MDTNCKDPDADKTDAAEEADRMPQARMDRRGMLAKSATLTAGAVAAAVGGVVAAGKAEAANMYPLVLGASNYGSSTTRLEHTLSGSRVSLAASDTNTTCGISGQSSGYMMADGVAGIQGIGDCGVLGENFSSGWGVKGMSEEGYGVWGLGKGNSCGVYGVNAGSGPGISGFGTSGPGVKATSAGAHGFYGASDNGRGVYGENTGSGTGVTGSSVSGTGVHVSALLTAVHGYTTNGCGVKGSSTNLHGVYGTVNSGDDKSGVYGDNFGTGPGVSGSSTSGPGVRAASTDSHAMRGEVNNVTSGVYGQNERGTGVAASSVTGIGLYGLSLGGVGVKANAPSGIGLHVDGEADFSQAGRSWMAKGETERIITGAALVGASSGILATLNGDAGTNVCVKCVELSSAAPNSFKIVLNAPATRGAYCSWFVLG